jgi:hypothetical protein
MWSLREADKTVIRELGLDLIWVQFHPMLQFRLEQHQV